MIKFNSKIQECQEKFKLIGKPRIMKIPRFQNQSFFKKMQNLSQNVKNIILKARSKASQSRDLYETRDCDKIFKKEN